MLDLGIGNSGEFSVVRSKGFALLTGAVSGGTGSVLGGGNFWMGAAQGVIVTTFNYLAHRESYIDGNIEGDLSPSQKQEIDIEKQIKQLFSSNKLQKGKTYDSDELGKLFPNNKVASYVSKLSVNKDMSLTIKWGFVAKQAAKVSYIRLEDGSLRAIPFKMGEMQGYKVSGGALYLKDGNHIYKNVFINGGNTYGILPNNRLTKYQYNP